MSDSLQESRRWCATFCRHSRSSFYYSFALLDQPRREAMHALYAFARITDDLGDSFSPSDERLRQLAFWQELLSQQSDPQRCLGLANSERCLPVSVPVNMPVRGKATSRSAMHDSLHLGSLADLPLWPALADAIATYQIPRTLLEAIIQGVTMDVQHQQPRDWLELQDYCYHVASAVGLACTYIWRPQLVAGSEAISPSLEQAAIDCGMAFQLTNILRDIAEDARVGRVYLPKTYFARYNVNRSQWLAARPSGQWEALIDEVAELARQRYTSGWRTIYGLSPSSQRMFSLMWRSYRGLLESVVADKPRLWSARRVRLSKRKRISLLTTHLLTPITTRLPMP